MNHELRKGTEVPAVREERLLCRCAVVAHAPLRCCSALMACRACIGTRRRLAQVLPHVSRLQQAGRLHHPHRACWRGVLQELLRKELRPQGVWLCRRRCHDACRWGCEARSELCLACTLHPSACCCSCCFSGSCSERRWRREAELLPAMRYSCWCRQVLLQLWSEVGVEAWSDERAIDGRAWDL